VLFDRRDSDRRGVSLADPTSLGSVLESVRRAGCRRRKTAPNGAENGKCSESLGEGKRADREIRPGGGNFPDRPSKDLAGDPTGSAEEESGRTSRRVRGGRHGILPHPRPSPQQPPPARHQSGTWTGPTGSHSDPGLIRISSPSHPDWGGQPGPDSRPDGVGTSDFDVRSQPSSCSPPSRRSRSCRRYDRSSNSS
jgi:hypothetical protein